MQDNFLFANLNWFLIFVLKKINEKPQVITDYEAGRGIPNQMILGKIERAIGIKLRGKDKGQPLEPPSSKAAAKKWKFIILYGSSILTILFHLGQEQ